MFCHKAKNPKETLQKKNHSVARKIKSIVPDISKFDFVKELTRDAQVIHGDLNYGNILFTRRTAT